MQGDVENFCNPDLHEAHSFASYDTKGDAEDLPSNSDPHSMEDYTQLSMEKSENK
jgi:hypothetical protein